MNPSNSLYRRQNKPTVEIPSRTVAECNARYHALRAAEDMNLATDIRLDR